MKYSKILSIIVPSYNMEAYLPKCLGSLVVDDLKLLQRLDVIVVNDGSKDRTSEIAHNYETKFPGVFRVIDKQNGNYGSCVNAGLSLRKGVWVRVLDADDYVDTSIFAEFVSYLSVCDADVVISDYDYVNADGKVLEKIRHNLSRNKFSLKDVPLGGFQLHAITYRSECFDKISYWQEEHISYTDTQWRILPMLGATKFCHFPHSVVRYLVGRDGQTMSSQKFSKDFWMLEDATLALVKGFCNNINKVPLGQSSAIRRLIVRQICFIYEIMVFGFNNTRVRFELGRFDRQLKCIDESIYEELAGQILIFGKLSAVDLIRSRHLLCGPIFSIARLSRFYMVILVRALKKIKYWAEHCERG